MFSIASSFKKSAVAVLAFGIGLGAATAAKADVADLKGTWINTNANTGGITKVKIAGPNANPDLRAWGSCSPSDCDWGWEDAVPLVSAIGQNPASADRLAITFDKSFKTTFLNAYRNGPKLVVEATTIYKDNRADRFNVYTFKKQPVVAAPLTNLEKMRGKWKNVDANTRGITKINVKVAGTNVKVRTFGSCSPTDCDWGWEDGVPLASSAGGNPTAAKRIMAQYDQGFATRTMTMRRVGAKLVVDVTTIYNDGRADRFNSYTFEK